MHGGNSSLAENQSILQQVNDLHILDALYDTIRILDPVEKKVHYLIKPDWLNGQDHQETCYCFWGKNTACENCASVRAFNQNKTVVKIEFKQDRVFMVMSAPLAFQGRKMIIELLKDITDNGIIDIEGKEVNEIQKMITEKNRLIIRDALSRIYHEEFIYERLPYNVYQAKQENKSLTLIYLRVTNLTAIIEMFGLKTGDAVIRKLAKSLTNYCRDPEDWAARQGSAGLILCLLGADENQAKEVCRQISEKIKKMRFSFETKRINTVIIVSFHTICNEIIAPGDFIQLARRKLVSETSSVNDLDAVVDEFFQKHLLTGREKEIAALVFNGQSTKEIAQNLFISTPTVKKHISAVFEKTGVKSRGELFAKYRSLYLSSEPIN